MVERSGQTFCFPPAGGGPNEDDCRVIADALLYNSENISFEFNATASGVGAVLPEQPGWTLS